jgi:hypothetical protein
MRRKGLIALIALFVLVSCSAAHSVFAQKPIYPCSNRLQPVSAWPPAGRFGFGDSQGPAGDRCHRR